MCAVILYVILIFILELKNRVGYNIIPKVYGKDKGMQIQKVILVVEDNEFNRRVLRTILSDKYKVLEAENGQEALSVLKDYKNEIALILLDIVMPVMDGYTFLSIVKADPAYSAIPVIVTTHRDSESDELAALSHGATDFLPKPYRPQIILHRVASIIHLRETASMVNQFRYDRLTGLYSKEYFYQQVREVVQQDCSVKYDIICSNIENFKLINDIFGRAAGDQLLCGIAELYQKYVGNKGICARLNADQFACLIKGSYQYTDELFIEVGEAVNELPYGKNVVMKWGIYNIDDPKIPIEQMCDRSLLAMRSIKGKYGKYFATYDDKLRGELLRQQAILDSMEAALAEEQFLVYLQPKYRLRDGALTGAEALVRWKHPQWGMQSPIEFIPVFEQNGFITQLDQYIWRKTCSIIQGWDRAGYPEIPVSVNVSRADIYNTDIVDILINIVEEYKLSPKRLHLEITESAYTENPTQIIETVRILRELGFVIEMDDFGTGYSSLNMLNQMPIDVLKLDMKFIENETTRFLENGILRFIMDLARWMKLGVVAEGVETREQMERLMEMGCDYVQGYYLAKPMPEEDFEKLMKDQKTEEEEEVYPKEKAPDYILIADEDVEYRKQMKAGFQNTFQVIEAGDWPGVKKETARYKDGLIAVVISITLPGMQDGTELETLLKEKKLWHTPVIITGDGGAESEEKALLLGAADYADKPHTAKSLYQRVLRAARMRMLQEREQTFQQEMNCDHMTGILNRRGGETAITSIKKEDAPFAFCLFDFDNLKYINDNFGHQEGDRLIREFGQILQCQTREKDIVSRFGGDEFVVILMGVGREEDAFKRCEEICRAMQKVIFGDGVKGTVSAGITISDGTQQLEEVIRRADAALYEAKAHHKGHAIYKRKESNGE